MSIINYTYLDISRRNKSADLSCKLNVVNTVRFVIHDSQNRIDYSKFNSMTIRSSPNNRSNVYTQTLNTSAIKEIEGIKYVEWIIPNEVISVVDKINLNLTVRYNNTNYTILEFKMIVYNLDTAEMNAVIQANRNLNSIIQTYLDSVKKSEINTPEGLIGLDANGKIDKNKIPFNFEEHVSDELYDTLTTLDSIHGLRINRDTYEVEYYDSDDEYWYVVNSVYGGSFTKQPKASNYDVFGGNFTDTNPPEETNLFGGNF